MKSLKYGIKAMVDRLPYLRRIVQERKDLQAENELLKSFGTWVPLGHFYSPFPQLQEIQNREAEIFNTIPNSLPGIRLNEEAQVDLFERLAEFYSDQPFTPEKQQGLRYFFENPSYSYGDGLILYAMIRHLQPRRIIEIGSGYSSCVMLDVNDRYFNQSLSCTFIEPYPDLLLSLITPEDRDRIQIISQPLQTIDTEIFSQLSENDILFIDSTHVTKIDSDVNHIFFRVLPAIQRGVYIHFHDIFYPFEYPKEWVYEGRGWNEAYLLRSFLQYNTAFEIQLFTTFLTHFYRDKFAAKMPLCLKNTGGNLWLKKR